MLRLRVLPTPGVAYLTQSLGADLGVVISASHNPMPDNGIKFLARGGLKLDDAVEKAIEEILAERLGPAHRRRRRPGDALRDAGRRSTSTTCSRTISRPLTGLKVVLDCAHGAAYDAGPHAPARRPAPRSIAIGAEPDGLNINDGCGSTHLGPLQEAVLAHGADAGFALDGDADRCLAVDHEGNDVDGDQILAILAIAMAEAGHLAKDTVVATVMSNIGFVRAMREAGRRRAADQGRRPLRPRGDAGQRLHPRR